jgi:hypothetical protein
MAATTYPRLPGRVNGQKGNVTMKPYHADAFLINSYSEDLTPGMSERDYNEAMAAFASDDMSDGDQWEGYGEWSQDVENLYMDEGGTVKHKEQPRSLGRLGASRYEMLLL